MYSPHSTPPPPKENLLMYFSISLCLLPHPRPPPDVTQGGWQEVKTRELTNSCMKLTKSNKWQYWQLDFNIWRLKITWGPLSGAFFGLVSHVRLAGQPDGQLRHPVDNTDHYTQTDHFRENKMLGLRTLNKHVMVEWIIFNWHINVYVLCT